MVTSNDPVLRSEDASYPAPRARRPAAAAWCPPVAHRSRPAVTCHVHYPTVHVLLRPAGTGTRGANVPAVLDMRAVVVRRRGARLPVRAFWTGHTSAECCLPLAYDCLGLLLTCACLGPVDGARP